ncbi:hypothetical protein J2T13_005000 [Paenibacillus sp. DS2015]|uniref:hypothetical protein n=1 Tax=Paenibacillus sp. DS2015 TaxID=3373917 RepID=UPI003D230B8C
MNSKSLPITISPIICYLHQAHQLCIVLTDEKKKTWFYNNYAQIYSRDKEIDLKFDFLSYDGKYARFPCINQNWLTRDFFFRTKLNLIQFIIDCIDQGVYCEIVVDEYYIPSKVNYLKKTYPHQNLIYGYDKDLQQFKIVGFNQANKFTEMEINFESLEKGFVHSPWAGVGFFDPTTDIEYTNSDLEVNLPLLKKYLLDYVNSTNSFVHYRPIDAVFGMDTYQLYKKEFLETGNSDIRPLHTFWEHKKHMVSRINYFKETGILTVQDDLQQRFVSLEKNFFVLRMLIMKYDIKNDRTILSKISSRLDVLIEEERDLLGRFISLL